MILHGAIFVRQRVSVPYVVSHREGTYLYDCTGKASRNAFEGRLKELWRGRFDAGRPRWRCAVRRVGERTGYRERTGFAGAPIRAGGAAPSSGRHSLGEAPCCAGRASAMSPARNSERPSLGRAAGGAWQ